MLHRTAMAVNSEAARLESSVAARATRDAVKCGHYERPVSSGGSFIGSSVFLPPPPPSSRSYASSTPPERSHPPKFPGKNLGLTCEFSDPVGCNPLIRTVRRVRSAIVRGGGRAPASSTASCARKTCVSSVRATQGSAAIARNRIAKAAWAPNCAGGYLILTECNVSASTKRSRR